MGSPEEGTRTIAGVVISDPVAGLFVKEGDLFLPLVERTEYVPNVPGQLFGCVFDYTNDTGRVVPYHWELTLPGTPGTAATIDGTTAVFRLADENRVVVHADGLFPGESAQYSVNRIDPGDPSGKWIMELYVGSELFDAFIFFVFSVP
ncbi:MAG: hypothetical protein JW765_10545 [Deltaproteobacteria bacterium]|nr:hypothetical protein [Candidatus Zymogenaceae bacterium]